MSDGTVPVIVARSLSGQPLRLRRRVALTFMAITVAACVVAAALLLSRAAEERRAIGSRALEAAKALSFGFDQEVAAVNYLLKGLSKSPALLSGDIKAFYDQLKATPVPEGSWLVLNDLERQVANTLRPFGVAAATARGLPELPGANGSDPGSEVGRLRPDAGSPEGQHHRGPQPPARRSGRPDERPSDDHPGGGAARRDPR